MFCPQCGKEQAGEANYCCQCGVRVPGGFRAKRKLTLSREDKKIGGVCGGFARYFGLDATLVRLAWVMLALLAGWGLIGYLIAWLIIPVEKQAEKPSAAAEPRPASAASQ
ncbi:MAG: PspC domain-containing protein [Terriglobia bacterium]